jgi:hypothetical protein
LVSLAVSQELVDQVLGQVEVRAVRDMRCRNLEAIRARSFALQTSARFANCDHQHFAGLKPK